MSATSTSVTANDIEEAYQKIQSSVRKTPLLRSENFERRIGAKFPIYFKVESLQYTGSFKSRGALNKLLSLSEASKKKGVITASAGNHAQGVAYHSQRLGIDAKIVMPLATPLIKIKSTKQWGAEVILFGESYQEAHERALEIQKSEGREYIHAFDDAFIIAGQGTIAKEVYDECKEIELFIAPMGGGGLLAGCGTYFKEKNSKIKMVAVQADGCSNFLPSLKAGKPVTLTTSNTIAEGIAVKRMGDMTFEICRKWITETVLVSDEETAVGLLWLLENERLFVEGCGGAAVAAVLKKPELITGPTVILLSGGNLDVNLLARIIERGLAQAGRLARFELTIPDAPGTLYKILGTIAEERASIIHVSHERIFGKTTLREVQARFILETHGLDHNERVKAALKKQGWEIRFL
ncbi:MAG: threonine ammonia-lyase [Bacteriovoracaceae bacterium]|nr:threonine ammonia-lyase [Bacteriovoracaceae bacterium]